MIRAGCWQSQSFRTGGFNTKTIQAVLEELAVHTGGLPWDQVSEMLDRVMQSELEIPRQQEPEGWQERCC